MQKKVIISVDSPSDINKSFQEEKKIDEVVPLHIILGEDSFDDGVTLNVDEMLDFYDRTSILPKTSAVSIDEYKSVFKKYPTDEYEIVHISLSSKISSTHFNAVMAAKECGNVFVVDSENLSLSIALLTLFALDLRDSGMPAREISEELARRKSNIKTAFILDSLEFLHKGGRCSSIAALGANLLKIKPCIVMEEGSLSLGKKYRGKLEMCQNEYIADRLAAYDNIDKSRIFIGYTSGMDEKHLNNIKSEIKKQGFAETYTMQVGCTITAHCGRNTFAIYFSVK